MSEEAIKNSVSTEADAKKKRIREIDYVKAFCILAMIIVHCYEEFYDGDGSGSYSLLVEIFNVVIGASAFMFCMGFTMDLGHEKSAGSCLKRGVTLFLMALLLNVLRTLPVLTHFFSDDAAVVFISLIDVLSVDILSFAGMAFLLMGILKKCRLKPWGIFFASLALSGIGTLLRYTDTGIGVVNSVLGLFIGSNAETFFPLCHWFVFVAAGNLYRQYYVKIEDKKKYYVKALPVAAVLSAVYIFLAWNEIGPFEAIGDEVMYYWMNPCDAIGSLFCVVTYLGVMWLLAQLVEKIKPTKFRPLSYLAENLSILYFIHWILIDIIEYVFMEGFELIPWPENDIAIFLYAIAFLALTILICELYKKYWRTGFLRSLKEHTAAWAVGIGAAVVICVVLALANGLTKVPSFLNEYIIDGIEYL